MKKLKLGNISAHLGTRFLGERVRHIIIHYIEQGHTVILDFDGVQTITSSFADEAVASLLDKKDISILKRKVEFRNLSSDILSILRYTIRKKRK